jgi:hypothetical protein
VFLKLGKNPKFERDQLKYQGHCLHTIQITESGDSNAQLFENDDATLKRDQTQSPNVDGKHIFCLNIRT